MEVCIISRDYVGTAHSIIHRSNLISDLIYECPSKQIIPRFSPHRSVYVRGNWISWDARVRVNQNSHLLSSSSTLEVMFAVDMMYVTLHTRYRSSQRYHYIENLQRARYTAPFYIETNRELFIASASNHHSSAVLYLALSSRLGQF